ncbi:MAG TPA: nuclear transport factor 2 family protein [Thermodesulfobacteriota bacterium]|jgi:ketosteroid isomerase-like protein|nr:nuclear transport factor 2 family protein [Thermodesulfobacteriota bacterium]
MSRGSDREEVLKVNQKFYEALGRRDLELMDTVWVKDSRAGCVHPGWIMLQGWEAIRQSWENVFDPRDQLNIRLSNVNVEVRGDVAWVTCIQELIYIKRNPIMMNISQSTNIFERHESGWLMVLHHASPIPVTYPEPEETQLQ